MSNRNYSVDWVEIDKGAISNNIKVIRRLIGKKVIMAPAVKGNAYGHGIKEVSPLLLKAGADWLSVNSLYEAELLRKVGIKSPIYILGYVLKQELADAIHLNCRIVVYNRETVSYLAVEARKQKKKALIHLKIETGNNRQGILPEEIVGFARFIARYPEIQIEGISTHFANLEDTTDTAYSTFQLDEFDRAINQLDFAGIHIPIRHCANSAATLLMPTTHMEMVRPGISVYGLWPSYKTKIQAQKFNKSIKLNPVLSWRTCIAQIKNVKKGAYIGYGCTYKTTQNSRIAILPIGYYDGYDRSGLSNKGHVLIRGKSALVRGRICMNIMMVDVTKIPEAKVEDRVTLLGRDGKLEISAEELAETCGTINYEITTRINERIPRIVV